jgi:hypothetical protein
MAEKRSLKQNVADRVDAGLKGQIAKTPPEVGNKLERGFVWVREDGAVCVGDECMVIKRRPETNDLDIDIQLNKCGKATASMFADAIYSTIGKGGSTHFTVKSDVDVEKDDSK